MAPLHIQQPSQKCTMPVLIPLNLQDIEQRGLAIIGIELLKQRIVVEIDDLVFSGAVREYAKANGLLPSKKLVRENKGRGE